MAQDQRIDVAKLRRAILAHLEEKGETRRGLSMRASENRNPDVVRDIFRVDKRQPLFDTVASLAAAMGKDVSDFVQGVEPAEGRVWLPVCKTVKAGVWTEQPDWDREECFEIEVEATNVAGTRFGAIAEGRSMDRVFTSGMILDCVSLIGSDIQPQDGDYVIVERVKDGLRETTCKRLRQREDGDYELIAESTLPEFREPIWIGRPDFSVESDDEVRVVAIVLSARLPLFRQKRRPISTSG
jgi:SOS-response transcriptional repressor LexA